MTGFGLSVRRTSVGFGVAVALGACSSGGSGLTTGSLLPGSTPKALDAPTERAMQVAVTSARASKCGYNFDAGRLRTSYLAYESTQDGSAEKLAKIEKSFDFTRNQATTKMGPSDEYCTDEQTGKIKSDLTRHLAGDFSPAAKKAEGGAFDWLQSKSVTKPFDPKEALCPQNKCI